MEFAALLTSIGTSFAIFVMLVVLYSLLSKIEANRVIYFPNKILKGEDERQAMKVVNPVRWITEAWTATEDEIVGMAGVDAAVYINFLATVLTILVASAAIGLLLLIPLSATDINYKLEMAKLRVKNDTKYDEFDKLSIGNVQRRSDRLWAFLFGVYWVALVTYAVLWKAYQHVLRLRTREQSSLQAKPEQFVILVRDIPPVPEGTTRKVQVDSFFRKIYPESFQTSLIVTDISKADKAWVKLEGYKKKLARAETIYEMSKTTAQPEGTHSTMRTGFLGLVGKKVDTVTYLNEKINEISMDLEKKQSLTLADKQVGAAFVIFNSRKAAAAAGQVIHAKVADAWTVCSAPAPCQIIWKNLSISFYKRIIREKIVHFIVFLIVLFYTIPITAISGITTLDNLKKYLPFLNSIVDKKALKTILEAYLPQLVLLVFLALLPMILLCLSKSESIPSQSEAVRAASGKYFYFIVFNVFLVFTLSGTLFDSFKVIQKEPSKIISILGTAIPPRATFFISFVALKIFVGYGLELSRIVSLIIFYIKKKFLCKTKEDIKEAWMPSGFAYATKVPNDMLILTITLCYCVIAPLILPFGVLYFALGWFVTKNQALNVYVAQDESYGRMWPHMHNRILASLFVSQLTMIGFFSIKFLFSPLLIPLPLITLVFSYVCRKRFYPSFTSVSMEVACDDVKDVPTLPSIVHAYTPPCLQSAEKFDEEKGNDFHEKVDALHKEEDAQLTES